MGRQIAEKVIIITGASSGIGRETALILAREGAKLVLVARRPEPLEKVRSELAVTGASILVLSLDLKRREDVERMVKVTRERFGRIDVLINNAGFGFFGTVENTPPSVVKDIFALNFEAALYATQLVIPVMRAQKSGQIINISSVAGKRGLPLSGIYCATKFALDGLTQSLRLELKDSGIDVSLVNPAATDTAFFGNIRRGDVVGKFKPMGYVQSPWAVAAAIVSCIRNPKLEVYPHRISRLIVWLNAVVPSLVDKVMVPYFRDRIGAKKNQ
jgi:short-subunit dehydrogenase